MKVTPPLSNKSSFKTLNALRTLRGVFNEVVMGSYALVFLLTGFIKWMEIKKFQFQLHLMPLPSWATDLIAYGLPSLTGVLGLWLLFGPYRRIPVILGTLVFAGMAIFVHLVLNFKLGPTYPCSCAGLFDLSWQTHFTANCWLAGAGTLTSITLNNDKAPLIPIVKYSKMGWQKIKQANLSGLRLTGKEN